MCDVWDSHCSSGALSGVRSCSPLAGLRWSSAKLMMIFQRELTAAPQLMTLQGHEPLRDNHTIDTLM
jgi:hypothetical protein